MVLICISLMSDIVTSLMYVGYVFIFFGEIIVQVVSGLLSPMSYMLFKHLLPFFELQ